MTEPKQINVMAAIKMAYAWNASETRSAGISMNQKRIGLLIVALLSLWAGPVFAQGTPIPYTIPQYFDANGDPLALGGLCTYEAGTTTLASVYTDSTLAVAHPNPVRFNAAGRPSVSNVTLPIFLSPGRSYKFVLKDATVTTCSPDTGVTLWSVDNVSAVPGSASAVDVTATAGESILAGEAVYVSTGTGGLNAGQLYKTDSDFSYKSTSAVMIGIAPNAISAGSSGTIRINGAVTMTGPLSVGAPYYVSATSGVITVTPPTNAIRIGTALSSTALIVGYTEAPVSPRGPPCGRLTLTSGLPVTVSDVTAATTVYYTPAGSCNTIDLFDGTAWDTYAFAELSIAVPATTNTIYDVFAYDNAGVVTLELTAWTNDTTRATALVLQNGVYAKTGALTRRYLGTFRTTGVSGQTEDSAAKRYVWNYYNRADRLLAGSFVTGTYNYTTNTFQQFNAVATVQLDVVVGVAGEQLTAIASNWAYNGGATVTVQISIGEDSTTAAATGTIGGASQVGALQDLIVILKKTPAVGRHFYPAIERSGAAGTTAWGPNANAMGAGGNAGIVGNWRS